MAGAPLAPAEDETTPGANRSHVPSKELHPLQALLGGMTLPPTQRS